MLKGFKAFDSFQPSLYMGIKQLSDDVDNLKQIQTKPRKI